MKHLKQNLSLEEEVILNALKSGKLKRIQNVQEEKLRIKKIANSTRHPALRDGSPGTSGDEHNEV